ncbi:MAG: DUF3592 domain-containing protein [Alphaproteobacteria bacterium]
MRWTIRKPHNHSVYSKPAGPISGFFMVLLGLALLAGAGWVGKNTYELMARGIRVEGKISDVLESLETSTRNRNGYSERVTETRYRYMVSFRDKNGVDVTFKDIMSDSHPTRQKGDVVTVLYLEKDAKGSAVIDRGAMNWLLPGALGVFGFFAIFGGGFAMVRKPATVAA